MGCFGCKACRTTFPRVVVGVGMFGVPGRDGPPPTFLMIGVDGREDKISSEENFALGWQMIHPYVTHSEGYLWRQWPMLTRSLDRVDALRGRVEQGSLGFPFFDTDRRFGWTRNKYLCLDSSRRDAG